MFSHINPKIVRIGIAAFCGYLGDGDSRLLEQALCFFHTEDTNVCGQGQSGRFFENAAEIGFVVVELLADQTNRQWFTVMVVYVFQCLP